MKKTILIILALMCGTICNAQKAETIETISATNCYDREWYGEQAKAWQKIVDENPQDQWAWRNLFNATFYYDTFGEDFHSIPQDETKIADVLRKMEQAIPDSYTLNLCRARYSMSNDTQETEQRYVDRAIELMPDDAYAGDVNRLACRMWTKGPDDAKTKELFIKNYKQNFYPAHILYYSWNMLQSMEPNAIYFGNGDNSVAPMKMLQDALGIRPDVTIIPYPYLFVDDFCQALYNKLNIKPFDGDPYDYWEKYKEEYGKHQGTDMVMYIIKQSKRPVYFWTDVMSWSSINTDSLYNEGLLLKFSDKKYDNFSVAMHNVTDVYHLEYLAEPKFMYDSWETCDRMDMNNVTLLSNLVYKLRKAGKKDAAERLFNILHACIKRCNIDTDSYLEYLESWNKKK